jgi:cAMP phosphodiesterase
MIDTVFGFQDTPLTVHALPETIDTLKQHVFNWRVWPDFAELPDKKNPSLRYVPMQHGEEIALDKRIIRMIPAEHTVPAAGYIVASSSGSFAFSGDTSINPALWQVLSHAVNLKLLIVECAFANEDQELSDLAKHYCPRYLAGDIKQLKNDVMVAITHLKPGYESVIIQECRAAMPGRELIHLRGGERFSI